ncbi:MAG: NIL domain-containing protein [Spirochaetia bacterium]|nr:NIL domain-containing protein [Spirochaetia bacterium]
MVKKIYLTIPKDIVHKPIIYELITKHKVKPNILEAKLDGESVGTILVEIEGNSENIKKSILYIKEQNIKVKES